ncbi:NINE protein [Silvibacterium acidisoli]|uniref:NINE protein n=1 Tax=Acidobacteriaceae bacterium ZG23-2 TaxID=2883246 RepID=UPI00406CCF5A
MSGSCPYCRSPFEDGEEIVSCPGCATDHHTDCFQENGGCTVFGCSAAPADEPKVSISNYDLATGGVGIQPAAPASSFLNLSAPEPPASVPQIPARTSTPPPPRPAGSTPPPPRVQTSHTPVMTYPTFGGYGDPAPVVIDTYTPRKSRVAYVLLAVFLGAFGGHNFYAGYVKKAVIQLCITVFTCFTGAIVSWIWAIVEACMVDRDDDGVAFV